VLVKPLTPETADGEVLAGCCRVVCAALAYDLPGDPPPAPEDVAGTLAPHLPGERVALWTAWEHGDVVALARLHLSDRDGPHSGLLFVDVHPAYRRRGIGTQLLGEAVRTLLAEGRRSLRVQVPEGTDAVRFAHAHGLRTALREARSLLDVVSVDGRVLDRIAEEEHPSYRLGAWVGHAPDDLLPSYAVAKRAMRDLPLGTLDAGMPEWDFTLLREAEDAARRRGQEHRVVVALHEPTGDVVGVTELSISNFTPRRAFQRDTAVLPAHRGNGLGLWMKAEMLRWLRAERQEVVEIVTRNAEDNVHMRQINERLGYKLDRWWHHCQADVHTLARRLGIEP
jgi:GNAT superfamily N-acetyltransferase